MAMISGQDEGLSMRAGRSRRPAAGMKSIARSHRTGHQEYQGRPQRVEAAKKAAAKAGITIKETLWSQGEYDFLSICEAADEYAATAFNINILKQGNVHTHTMRAFTAEEMTKILAHVD